MTDKMTAERAIEELLDAATSIVMTADFDEAEKWAAIIRQALTAPWVPQLISESVAWAVFSERGNIRIWCSDPIQLESLRAEYGDQLKPLYMLTTAPAPADDGPMASIDDIWVASGEEYDRSIHSNPDHYAWAELFVSTFPNLRADVDTMAGWFANAMMAKVDSMRARTAAPAPADSFAKNYDVTGDGVAVLKPEAARRMIGLDKPMPLFETAQGGELTKLRERERELEQSLEAARGWLQAGLSAINMSGQRGGSDD